MIEYVICIPTRGLLFTEVIQSIQSQTHAPILFTSGEPTPQAFNTLVRQALALQPKAILFVEEDTVPPERSIPYLFNVLMENPRHGAVALEYPVAGGHSTVVHVGNSDTIAYCGLGCTMVRRKVFDCGMADPWFRSDWQFVLEPEWKRGWHGCDPEKQYGLYDVLFFTRLRYLGYEIVQVGGRCRHLQVEHTHTPQQNGSINTITEKSLLCTRSEIAFDPLHYWKERETYAKIKGSNPNARRTPD